MDNNLLQVVLEYFNSTELEHTISYETNRYIGFKVYGTMYAEVAERKNFISILVRGKYVTKEEMEELDIIYTEQESWTLDTMLKINSINEFEKYKKILKRAYEYTKLAYSEKIKAKLMEAYEEDKEYVMEYANNEEYAFEKLTDIWNRFNNYDISNTDLDILKSDLQALDKFQSESFCNRYIDDDIKYNFLQTLYEVISYIDKNAAGKEKYNKYNDKRTLALTFVRQNDWVNNLINYKKYKDLSKVTEVCRNVISYMKNPTEKMSVFKDNKLVSFCKYIYPGIEIDNSYERLCNIIYEYLEFLNIKAINPKNQGILYGRLIFAKAIYKEWDVENIFWKIQPYNEKNLSSDEITENINKNVIVSKDKSLIKNANNNIFYMAEDKKPLFLGAFIEQVKEIEDGFYSRKYIKLAKTNNTLGKVIKDKAWGDKYSSKTFISVKAEETQEFETNIINTLFDEDIDILIDKIKNIKIDCNIEENIEDEVVEENSDEINEIVEINTPLNLILYGPPGTGKTYNTVNYSVSIIEKVEVEDIVDESKENRAEVFNRYKKYLSEKKIVFTTFHQNYSYEEFIQGIRANTNNTDSLSFVKEDGIFKDLVERAKIDPSNNYVMIIDEINRGNISRIFGELITLIEDDKRLGKENEIKVTLPSKEVFGVPSNLYIIGTMNTADKSIALIDIALRRRFDFVGIYPDYTVITQFENILKPINKAIYEKKRSADYLIGHAFFVNKSIDDLENIVNKKIIPLLNEYFYSNINEVQDILSLGGINTEIDMNTFQLRYSGLEE